MHHFWRHAQRAFEHLGHCGGWAGGGPGTHAWEGPAEEGYEGFAGGGGGLGVRRPLRFLAHKLGLDERQIAEMARVLSELKTERAQAEVDRQRTVAAFADAMAGDSFDAAKAGDGGELRLKSAERLRGAVLKALQQIHAILNPDQRLRLAYLIRTGRLFI
ncbi:MAG TPA: Spy/CpxP family protein refolding chaperone [Gemmataceae bacterium]|nr:Spy/CpxP family protein refolding chaperone [Gemmataceae bacterium]